ncbi:MAG TPA: hypothetical protein VFU19_18915 [Iamia sp.]|nr:hypothetical protein [Iamia sp.]
MTVVVPDQRRSDDPPAARPRRRRALPLALAGLVLAATQAPITAYSQNQSTYLVRAVAATTAPELRADRLVRSTDPTPVFTLVSRGLIALADGPFLLYGVWLLAGVAFFAALRLAVVEGDGGPPAALLAWTAVVAVVGGSGLDLLDDTVLASPLQGVAGQYALGPVLQPSTAGVLLVVAVARAARRGLDRTAVVALFAAALIHPSYLAAAWVVLAAAAIAEVARGGGAVAPVVRPVVAGVVASVGVVLANITSYAGSLDPAADEANRVLAEQRIPHHALPSVWIDARAVVVLVVVLGAAALARRSASAQERWVGTFLLAGAALVVVATGVVGAIGSPTLLLSFPWRASVCLVPLATSLLAARAAGALTRALSSASAVGPRIVVAVAVVLVALSASSGLDRTQASVEHSPADGALVVALRDREVTGEGLIPTGRVVGSATQVVDDVRINAGLPVFVDLKNNPNEPAAVLAWRDRLDEADAALSDPDRLCALLDRHDLAWAAVPPDLATEARARCLPTTWSATPAGDLTLLTAPT